MGNYSALEIRLMAHFTDMTTDTLWHLLECSTGRPGRSARTAWAMFLATFWRWPEPLPVVNWPHYSSDGRAENFRLIYGDFVEKGVGIDVETLFLPPYATGRRSRSWWGLNLASQIQFLKRVTIGDPISLTYSSKSN